MISKSVTFFGISCAFLLFECIGLCEVVISHFAAYPSQHGTVEDMVHNPQVF